MTSRERVERIRYPYLPVTVTVGEHVRTAEAQVDTGFDGDLAVASELAYFDGEVPIGLKAWQLGDASRARATVYAGTVQTAGMPPVLAEIAVIGNEVLLGRGICDLYRVTFDHGQRIMVEP